MRVILAMIAAATAPAACSGRKRDVNGTVFAPRVKALEKAREVEGELQQGAAKERAALETSENSAEANQKPPGY